jgi:hypothetical protein
VDIWRTIKRLLYPVYQTAAQSPGDWDGAVSEATRVGGVNSCALYMG